MIFRRYVNIYQRVSLLNPLHLFSFSRNWCTEAAREDERRAARERWMRDLASGFSFHGKIISGHFGKLNLLSHYNSLFEVWDLEMIEFS